MRSFDDYYYRKYSTRTGTYENVFCVLIYFVIIAVPFYFSFGGSNFWFTEKYDLLSLEYSFTGYYSIEVVYFNSIQVIRRQYANIPASSLSSLNNYGFSINDNSQNMTTIIDLNGFTDCQIQSINGAFFYDVKIPSFDRILSSAYLFSLSGNIETAKIYGQMRLITSSPINILTQTQGRTINTPAYYTKNFKAPATYQQIVEAQFSNPFRLQGQKYQSVTESSLNIDSRKIQINLQKDAQIVLPYYPSMLETMKFNFSRYFGFLILSYLIFRNLMLILIKEEGLQCHIQDEKPPIK